MSRAKYPSGFSRQVESILDLIFMQMLAHSDIPLIGDWLKVPGTSYDEILDTQFLHFRPQYLFTSYLGKFLIYYEH